MYRSNNAKIMQCTDQTMSRSCNVQIIQGKGHAISSDMFTLYQYRITFIGKLQQILAKQTDALK